MTPEQSVPFGLLAMYAEDMYDVDQGALAPTPDLRIAASGWKIVNYLTAQDVLIPTVRNQRLSFDRAKRVFFGFLAQSNADPTSYVVAIRGTIGFAEWIIDGQFLLVPHPNLPTAKIEQGFWDIYRTMNLADPVTGATTNPDAAAGVAAVVGAGNVVVTGHSLGSALATYFTSDLAGRLGNEVSACLFASPRTGDDAWVNLFDTNVSTYQVWNCILDVVPHVPTLGYATLPKTTVIQPSTAQCQIRLDLTLRSPRVMLLRDDRLQRHDGSAAITPGCERSGMHLAAADAGVDNLVGGSRHRIGRWQRKRAQDAQRTT